MRSIRVIAKKTSLLLMVAATLALSLPANIVLGTATTVEVNNGSTLTLNAGASITASTSTGIPVTVKNLPNLGAPANGLAGFTFNFSWNPAVIRVDSAFGASAATGAGWSITPGSANNTAGTLTSTGFTTTYSTDNITLLYLGITAVGSPGSSTAISVAITSLGDKDGNPITATPVNAPVEISLGELQSIVVSPTSASVAKGLTQQFTANGTFQLGSKNITTNVTWTSSNTSVATINSAGLASTLAVGSTNITASSSNSSGTVTSAPVTLTVAPAVLLSIAVTPAAQTIVHGMAPATQQFTATGNYTDGPKNITCSVTWSSSNTSVATIASCGLATSVWAGSTIITATSGSISGSTTLTVAINTTVEVNNGSTVALNVGQSIAASGSSGLPVTVKGLPNLSAPANGLAGFRFDFSWNPAVIRVDSAVGASAAVSSANWTIVPGTPNNTNGTLTSTGFTTTYSTANTTLLYLGITAVGSTGANTTLAVAITSLVEKNGTAIPALPVNAPVQLSLTGLLSIAVTPANQTIVHGMAPATQQFSAIATYADASTANITSSVTWTSSNTSVATISSTGLATSVWAGSTNITATSSSISGSTTLTVAINTTVEVNNGSTVALNVGQSIAASASSGLPVTVKGLPNLSAPANGLAGFRFDFSWNPAVIRVDSAVGATAAVSSANWTIIPGTPNNTTGNLTVAGITATYSTANTTLLYLGITAVGSTAANTTLAVAITNLVEKNGTAIPALPVNAPVQISLTGLQSIAVTPINPSVAKGLTKQFTAIATYADASTANITSSVTWTSSNTTVATISTCCPPGLATALAVGTTTITATLGNISGTTMLTVTAAQLVSIVVTPANPSIPWGLTQPFAARGFYTDSSNVTPPIGGVSWTSNNTLVATINSASGLATSTGQGTANITATSGSIKGSTTLTVTAPVLLSIAVTPSFASIHLGLSQNFTATGNYTNGFSNITGSVTWLSSNTTVATINSAGLATSVAQGTTIITASLSGITSPGAILMVKEPQLLSLTVSPVTANVTAGATKQFTATGNFTDNPSRDITNTATWTSSDPSIASIQSAFETSPGLAKGFKPGTVTITATLGGKSATANLTVTAATISTIQVTPVNPTITQNSTQQFRAVAVKSDGSLVDITTTANWTSSPTSIATISATGLATASATNTGNVTITASSGTASGSTSLTVIAVPLVSIAVTPANQAIAAGKTQQFTATGNYSGTPVDLTGRVTWSSSNNATARIVSGGLATSYAQGSTTISATFGTISGNTTLTVTAAVLDFVKVTPVNPTITFISGAPPTLQFKATAILSDGSTSDNTTTANWMSSDTNKATIGANTGLATTVAAGTTTISATLAGKTGTSLLTVLADTVAPVVRLTSPSEGRVLPSANVTVIGNVDDVNATVTIIVNEGAPIGPVSVNATNGEFTRVLTSADGLKNGNNTILVKAVDGAGNVGTSGTRAVLVDVRKPNITIDSPSEEFVTNNATKQIAVTWTVVSAPTGQITLKLNGAVVSQPRGTGTWTDIVTLKEGRNILIASGLGTGGEEASRGTSGARTVILDTTKPVVVITSPASGSIFNVPGITVKGTVNDPTVDNVTLKLNNLPQSVPVRGGKFSQDIKLATGSNNITAQAIDRAGNIGSSAEVKATFDPATPEVIITAPANNLMTNVGGQLVTGNISDPAITTATLLVNSVNQTIAVAPDGSFSQIVALAAGLNTIEVQASAFGKTGTSGIIKVTLDTTPPVVVIGLSDPTDSITITVTSDEGLTAVPIVTVNPAITMTPVGVNKWTGIFAIPAPGQYTVNATGTDLAGNPTTTTATFLKQALNVVAGNATSIQAGATSLSITANTTLANQSITVTQHTENPAENTASNLAAGIFVEIVASGNLTGSIQTIEIRVNYDEADIIARGIDESTLKLYLWSTITGQWEEVPGSGVNTAQNYIFGTATHLSKYGSFGTAKKAEEPKPAPAPVPFLITTTVSTPGLTAVPLLQVDSSGIVQANSLLTTADLKASLNIAKGTKILDAQGSPLSSLSAAVVTAPPAPPTGKAIVSAYDFGPDGATFTPTITLTMTYTAASLPAGAKDAELYLAYWDGTKWVALTSTVNTTAKTVAAQTNHFTQFALISTLPPAVVPPPPPPPPPAPPPPAPAAFATSDLTISPTTVGIGEKVTISVLVTNKGELSGKYTVTLKINNLAVETKDVTLDGGAKQTVTFTTSRDAAGTYTVTIDALSGTFTVTAPPPVPEKPTIPAPIPEKGVAVWVWVLIGLAVVVIAVVIWIVIRRRTA